jgi:ABC-type multidrug transport system ATPase subunit
VPVRGVVLCARELCFGFGTHVVFADFSTQVPPGVTWVHGDEGSGKTTLLRLMAGDLAAHGGHLQINGVSLADDPHAYRRQVFWADPRSEAFDAVTPAAYWSAAQQRYPLFDAELLADLTDSLALAQHQNKALYMLSTGSKRKVWLAAALACGAVVTLLDEPFAALDKASIAVVLEVLQDAASRPDRAWVVADYQAPSGVALASTLLLQPLV